MPIVNKPLDLPSDKLSELSAYLSEKFSLVVAARKTQIDDKALRWAKGYDATPAQEIRTTPYYRASNFMPQLIRMHSDILGARIVGIMVGTKPFWMVKSMLREYLDPDVLGKLSMGLNYLWESDLNGFETLDAVVNDSLQTGTLILKSIWSTDSGSYMDSAGEFKERDLAGMQFDPVPFEDFWPYPITALNTRKAEILFHRIRLTERDVEERKKSGKWKSTAAEAMFEERKNEPLDEARAQSSGINLTADVDYPYSAIECWLNWEVGGKMRPIVAVINPMLRGEDAILKLYYNFMPFGETPFTDFRPMRRKGSFYGYSVPEILEQSQEEQAQIHNSRRDANTIANIPSWKKKRYADVPNPATDWYPGCIIELDEMDDMEFLGVQGNYNGMIDEEQFLLSLAERYVGISPSMQGFSAGQAAGKRGIYATGGTLALLSEGNRRLDIYIQRNRYPFHRLGRTTALCYNQFAPNHFDKYGKVGAQIKAAFGLVDPSNGSLLYDTTASQASSNREVDRQSLIQASGVMGNYYEKIIELTAQVRALQPNDPLRPIALMVLDGARSLAKQLLFAFDIGDRDRLAPDAAKLLGEGQPGATAPGPQPNDADGGGEPSGAIRPSQLEDVLKNIAAVSR